jgi:predicted enzyme related to lactoylglutathione lyase
MASAMPQLPQNEGWALAPEDTQPGIANHLRNTHPTFWLRQEQHSLASETNFTTQKGFPMKIKLTSIYVDDQEKALTFYTDILGFKTKADFTSGSYRWLTVVSPEEPNGTELQLALNDNPITKTYQHAIYAQSTPAANFFVADAEAEYERLKALGVTFSKEPTKNPWGTLAVLDDTCGNLIQFTQLNW